MAKKLLSECLLIAALFFFSCEKLSASQMNESEISIKTISMITFLGMGVAILIAYRYKKR
ncbi:MAG: hypothetical protein LBE92_19425 [Chryseobacterium sp.]|jgi:hypothetical protein|uniref:hypothetical protein n=1 Tax=Chryseobacterium sp. TaxID=1871047 RepID=UPI002836F95E|nr:hypothetical protein [Chryseobacterium sp.]MDR2238301.1 hypothetical protein [Chryseobacterium sp.]